MAILVPVLRRPQNVARVLDSALSAVPSARVLFICDPDDEPEIQTIKDEGGDFISPGGNYASKINAGVAHTSEPLLFTGADDIHFHQGWLGAAKDKMTDGIEVVGTNDLIDRRTERVEHATHFLVTREYADLGTIDGNPGLLFEGYDHSWCDNEFIETAKIRQAYTYASDVHVEHRHPMNGTAPDDEVYLRGREKFHQDHQIFVRRSALWAR